VGQAIRRTVQFGLECTEHPVPHDQDSAVVAVQVDGVRAVVHPVVGRRVEDELDRPGQLLDQLGVHEELVHQVEPVADVQRPRRHPEQRQRQPEEEVEPGVPLLPQRGAEVHVLRGVVRLVRRPAHPDAVGEPVIPVVGEVDAGEGQCPRPPGAHRQVPGGDVAIKHAVDDEPGRLHGGDADERAGPHQQGRRGVLARIPGIPVFPGG
jgi:hypothetical protein